MCSISIKIALLLNPGDGFGSARQKVGPTEGFETQNAPGWGSRATVSPTAAPFDLSVVIGTKPWQGVGYNIIL